jgi:hypothetical protein
MILMKMAQSAVTDQNGIFLVFFFFPFEFCHFRISEAFPGTAKKAETASSLVSFV